MDAKNRNSKLPVQIINFPTNKKYCISMQCDDLLIQMRKSGKKKLKRIVDKGSNTNRKKKKKEMLAPTFSEVNLN